MILSSLVRYDAVSRCWVAEWTDGDGKNQPAAGWKKLNAHDPAAPREAQFEAACYLGVSIPSVMMDGG
jgi:hypothetical protein